MTILKPTLAFLAFFHGKVDVVIFSVLALLPLFSDLVLNVFFA